MDEKGIDKVDLCYGKTVKSIICHNNNLPKLTIHPSVIGSSLHAASALDCGLGRLSKSNVTRGQEWKSLKTLTLMYTCTFIKLEGW